MIASIILTQSIGNLFNNLGSSILGSYDLLGLFIIILLLVLMYIMEIPPLFILGSLSICVVILNVVWGGVFTKLATVGAIIFGTLMALFIVRLFTEGNN